MSRIIDWTDRETCVLFGDGAGAVVLEAADEPGIYLLDLGADGRYRELLYASERRVDAAPREQRYPGVRMKGNEVFKVAVKTLENLVDDVIAKNGLEKGADRLADSAPGQHPHHQRYGQAARHADGAGHADGARRTATPRRPRCRWRSIPPSATAASSAAICCCSRLSAAGSPGVRPGPLLSLVADCRLALMPSRLAIRIMPRMARRLARSFCCCVSLGATARAAEYWVADNEEVVRRAAARQGALRRHVRRAGANLQRRLRVAAPRQSGRGSVVARRRHRDHDPDAVSCCRGRRGGGIVVNVAELRLYYFPADSGTPPPGVAPGARRVVTHPISVGRMDWSTPLGVTKVTARVANPSWYPPQSIRDEHAARDDVLPRVVPPGPDNPLGNHALRLGLPGYLIHGTNMPSGVGMRVTHGCIRMFPEDIEVDVQDGADRHGRPDRESAGQARLDGRRRPVSRVAPAVAGEQRSTARRSTRSSGARSPRRNRR